MRTMRTMLVMARVRGISYTNSQNGWHVTVYRSVFETAAELSDWTETCRPKVTVFTSWNLKRGYISDIERWYHSQFHLIKTILSNTVALN